ncbi:hypothetical protein N9I95_02020 [Flavobacteriaceae bacterium]|nr:hypothetical protein [Flavobacteriaceae bacterium]
MDNKRIITNLEALLDGYLTTTGESIENNIIINDREIVKTLQSVIEKLNNNVDESTTTQLKKTISKNEINEIGINYYKKKINALGMHKVLNSQILKARIKFKRAYEDWSIEEDSILKAIVSMGLSLEQIVEILQRGKGSVESRIEKHKIELICKNQFIIEDDSKIKSFKVVDNIKTEEDVVQEDVLEKAVVEEIYAKETDIKQINQEKSITHDKISNKLLFCIYCKNPFPVERKKLGFNYCISCSSEKTKTFVDKGFQTREGHKIMSSKGYRNSKRKNH